MTDQGNQSNETSAEHFHVWTVWHPRPANIPALDTFRVHKNILLRHGEAYWGVISDKDYGEEGHPFEQDRLRILDQIQRGTETYLYAKPRDDQTKPLKGVIKDVLVKRPEGDEADKIPAYYRRICNPQSTYRITYWFLLNSIDEIEPTELDGLHKIADFDPAKHGGLGYPYPCACVISDNVAPSHISHFHHADNYRYIKCREKEYRLSYFRAQAVRVLHEAYLRGIPEVHQDQILNEIESDSRRLQWLFKDSPVWGELILNTKPGFYKLNI